MKAMRLDHRLDLESQNIAVVIPCYKVKDQISKVLDSMPDYVWRIYVVDDACPQHTGNFVQENYKDKRIVILRHEINQGVGGAVMTGYQKAMDDGAQVIVKIDGDGQMNPVLIPSFVTPILTGRSDYTKGNRFYNIEDVKAMPTIRLLGNAILSFMTKLSGGYWHLFDPTNGYTAIHASVVKELPLEKIDKRYFFESDLLFRLNIARAVVEDVPMRAIYQDEESNLQIKHILVPFIIGHIKNFGKRIFYNYFLRDFSLASIQLLLSIPLLLFGLIFGFSHWAISQATGIPASAGTVMLSALPIIIGLQFLLSFLHHDILSVPRRALHRKI